MEISKLDAAKRELETAIRLFLNYADPVSIHLLAHTTLDLLKEMGKKEGVNSIVFDTLKSMVKKHYREKFLKVISDPGNYFKHYHKKPNKSLKFNPKSTEFLIYDACMIYEGLTKEKEPIFQAYIAFFRITHKEAFFVEKREEIDNLISEIQNDGHDLEDRSNYLALANALAENQYSIS